MIWKFHLSPARRGRSACELHGRGCLLATLLGAATVVLFALAGCRSATPAPPAATIVAAGFAGNEACSACHSQECSDLAASRHAHTLRQATAGDLKDIAPPEGAVPLAGYAIGVTHGRYSVNRQYPKAESFGLDYALGSGKTGVTYVSVVDNDRLMETKMSYFPHQSEWEITPGQEIAKPGDTAFGRIHDSDQSRRCIQCHAVAVVPGGVRSAPGFYGVGCESCHGAGRAHIEAVKAGRLNDLKMARLKDLPSAKLNDLCGQCHRTTQQIDIDTPMAEQTHRFQPFGLARSRCRDAAGGPLSCLTCHAPHKDASTDKAYYNRICMTCHNGGSAPRSAVNRTPQHSAGHLCPVDQSSRCIDCHMRPKKAFLISTFPGTMVDHLISVPPKRGK